MSTPAKIKANQDMIRTNRDGGVPSTTQPRATRVSLSGSTRHSMSGVANQNASVRRLTLQVRNLSSQSRPSMTPSSPAISETPQGIDQLTFPNVPAFIEDADVLTKTPSKRSSFVPESGGSAIKANRRRHTLTNSMNPASGSLSTKITTTPSTFQQTPRKSKTFSMQQTPGATPSNIMTPRTPRVADSPANIFQSNHMSKEGDDRIKVVTRFRTLASSEQRCTFADGNVLVHVDSDEHQRAQKQTFAYDYVFDESARQRDLFEAIGKDSTEQVLNGFNATIMAYGQTSSGKTYTMRGLNSFSSESSQDEVDGGLVPRCVEYLFQRMDQIATSEPGVTFTMSCSYLEVYCEVVFDLLAHEDNAALTVRAQTSSSSSTSGSGTPRPSNVTSFYADGLTETRVSNMSELGAAIRFGDARRKVAATLQNERSSRSHALLTLTVRKIIPSVLEGEEPLVYVSKLNLVDLAGSEKLNVDKAQESKKINLSLTILSKVMLSLSQGTSHVGFRESELTKLLADSLSGSAKTTLIACINPDSSNRVETLSTLRFASNAKKIPIHAKQWALEGAASKRGKDAADLRELREVTRRADAIRELLNKHYAPQVDQLLDKIKDSVFFRKVTPGQAHMKLLQLGESLKSSTPNQISDILVNEDRISSGEVFPLKTARRLDMSAYDSEARPANEKAEAVLKVSNEGVSSKSAIKFPSMPAGDETSFLGGLLDETECCHKEGMLSEFDTSLCKENVAPSQKSMLSDLLSDQNFQVGSIMVANVQVPSSPVRVLSPRRRPVMASPFSPANSLWGGAKLKFSGSYTENTEQLSGVELFDKVESNCEVTESYSKSASQNEVSPNLLRKTSTQMGIMSPGTVGRMMDAVGSEQAVLGALQKMQLLINFMDHAVQYIEEHPSSPLKRKAHKGVPSEVHQSFHELRDELSQVRKELVNSSTEWESEKDILMDKLSLAQSGQTEAQLRLKELQCDFDSKETQWRAQIERMESNLQNERGEVDRSKELIKDFEQKLQAVELSKQESLKELATRLSEVNHNHSCSLQRLLESEALNQDLLAQVALMEKEQYQIPELYKESEKLSKEKQNLQSEKMQLESFVKELEVNIKEREVQYEVRSKELKSIQEDADEANRDLEVQIQLLQHKIEEYNKLEVVHELLKATSIHESEHFKQIREQLNAKVSQLEYEKTNIAMKNSDLISEMTALKCDQAIQAKEFEIKVSQAEAQFDQAQKLSTERLETIEQLKETLRVAEAHYVSLKSDYEQLYRKYDEKVASFDESEKLSQSRFEKLSILENTLEMQKTQMETLKAELVSDKKSNDLEISNLRLKLSTFSDENAILRAQLDSSNSCVQGLESSLSVLRTNMKELSETLKQKESLLDFLNSQNMQLKGELEANKEFSEQSHKSYQRISRELSESKTDFLRLQQELVDCQEQSQKLLEQTIEDEGIIKQLRGEISSRNSRILDQTAMLEAKAKANEAAMHEVDLKLEEVKGLRVRVSDLENDISSREEALNILKAEYSCATTKLELQSSEIGILYETAQALSKQLEESNRKLEAETNNRQIEEEAYIQLQTSSLDALKAVSALESSMKVTTEQLEEKSRENIGLSNKIREVENLLALQISEAESIQKILILRENELKSQRKAAEDLRKVIVEKEQTIANSQQSLEAYQESEKLLRKKILHSEAALSTARHNVSEREQQIAAQASSKSSIDQELAETKLRLDMAESSVAKLHLELEEKIQSLLGAKNRFDDKESETIYLRGQISSAKAEIDKTSELLRSEQDVTSSLKAELAENTEKIEAYQRETKEVQESITKLECLLSQKDEAIQKLEKVESGQKLQIKQAMVLEENFERSMEEKNVLLATRNNCIFELEAELTQTKAQLTEKKKEIESASEQMKQLHIQISAEKAKVEELKSELSEMSLNNSNMDSCRRNLEKCFKKSEKKLQSKVDILEVQLEASKKSTRDQEAKVYEVKEFVRTKEEECEVLRSECNKLLETVSSRDNDVAQTISELEEERQRSQAQIALLNEVKIALAFAQEKANNTAASFIDRMDSVTRDLEKAEIEVEKVHHENSNLKQALEENEKLQQCQLSEYNQLESKLFEYEKRITDLENALKISELSLRQAVAEANSLNSTLSECNSRCKALEQSLAESRKEFAAVQCNLQEFVQDEAKKAAVLADSQESSLKQASDRLLEARARAERAERELEEQTKLFTQSQASWKKHSEDTKAKLFAYCEEVEEMRSSNVMTVTECAALRNELMSLYRKYHNLSSKLRQAASTYTRRRLNLADNESIESDDEDVFQENLQKSMFDNWEEDKDSSSLLDLSSIMDESHEGRGKSRESQFFVDDIEQVALRASGQFAHPENSFVSELASDINISVAFGTVADEDLKALGGTGTYVQHQTSETGKMRTKNRLSFICDRPRSNAVYAGRISSIRESSQFYPPMNPSTPLGISNSIAKNAEAAETILKITKENHEVLQVPSSASRAVRQLTSTPHKKLPQEVTPSRPISVQQAQVASRKSTRFLKQRLPSEAENIQSSVHRSRRESALGANLSCVGILDNAMSTPLSSKSVCDNEGNDKASSETGVFSFSKTNQVEINQVAVTFSPSLKGACESATPLMEEFIRLQTQRRLSFK